MTQENSKLLQESRDLQGKVKSLEEVVRSKGVSIPIPIFKRPKLTFSFKETNLNLFPVHSPPKNNSNAGVGQPPQKMEATKLYKDCILTSNGRLYEDDVLKVALIRSVDSSTKTATLKLNFFNKSKDTPLLIQQFSPVQYNKAGISINEDVALAVSSGIQFPLSVKPRDQANGDVQVILRKYLAEDTIFNLEYQYVLVES